MSDAMEYRCFIGGLSWSTSDRTLEDAFEKFGRIIEAKVVIDRDTGRSRGFGFVTFDEKEAMEDAISRMHGMELDGRSITVDKAQPKSAGDDRGDRGGDRGFGGGRRHNGGGGGGGSECFKCGEQGHFARECPNGEGHRGGDRYGSRSGDRHGGGGGKSRYGSDRNGDRNGGRSRDGGGHGGSSNDRYGRDRSGPYHRASSGGSRSYDDRH